MADQEARKRLQVRIANGRRQIDRALEAWELQARDAADAWDGEGPPPFIWATTIMETIDERAEAIAAETARRIREGN